MALTSNFNYLQPTGFKLVIDRKNYPNLEFFVQDFTHAGVIMNTADLGYKKIAYWLNQNQYKTPRGHEFKNNHVHSIL